MAAPGDELPISVASLVRRFTDLFETVQTSVRMQPTSTSSFGRCPETVSPNYFPKEEIQAIVMKTFSKEKSLGFSQKHKPANVTINGKPALFYFSVTESRNYGLLNRQLFEDVHPNALPPGVYSFVITSEGHVVFGQVANHFEYGAKHFTLANGRSVVAAGEMRIEGGQPTEYNLLSGTYTYRLTHEPAVTTITEMKNGVESILRTLKVQPKYIEQDFPINLCKTS
jgi:hypothetical protein